MKKCLLQHSSLIHSRSLVDFLKVSLIGLQREAAKFPYHKRLSVIFLEMDTETEFLDEIQTKALRVFLLAIHSPLYNFVLRFLYFILKQNP
jgi:hypothetical protein